jgi:lipopolysaccharide transport system permease protein
MPAAGHTLPVSSGARKRDLWWQFTVRTVESRYRGSYLGLVWAVLNPLLMLAVYYVVFGLILGGHFRDPAQESQADFAMAMFLGLTLYLLVADTLGTAPLLIVSNANLVKKVVFPLEILPLAQTGSLWLNLAIGLVLAIGGAMVVGTGVSLVGLAWLPVILLPLLLLSAGLSYLFAALGVFYRDLAQVMPFVSQILLYASAVFYPASRLPHAFWSVLRWNPFLETVILSREVVLWGAPMDFTRIAYTYAAGAAVLVVGRIVFLRLRPAFSDVI